MRDGANRAFGYAILASILLHALLLAALPALREFSARLPADPAPLTEESRVRGRLYPHRGETPRRPDDPHRAADDYDKLLVERPAPPAAPTRGPRAKRSSLRRARATSTGSSRVCSE